MEYSDYSYSAATQAEFFRAEAELIRLGDRLVHSPTAKYMKSTLLAIDAVFAIRMSHDVDLPAVSLITAFDLIGWKYHGDVRRSVRARLPEFKFPDGSHEAAVEALHYMQTMDWVVENARPDTVVTLDTVLHLHDMLINGSTDDNRYQGFRTSFLPHKKGSDPAAIPAELSDLCCFANSEMYSPLGQASVIHHAFERIVPFDSMIDRTGLVLSFMSLFRRGLFPHGYMVPICWGASIGKEYRRKLKDSSRDLSSPEEHERFRECWAVYNAHNTYLSVAISDSFLSTAGKLRSRWRSQDLQIPANSALDRLLDLMLCMPGLSTIRASKIIGKSYGATNEAMRQLAKCGIVREIALDGRERIFICDQSAAMISEFVDNLVDLGEKAEVNSARGRGFAEAARGCEGQAAKRAHTQRW